MGVEFVRGKVASIREDDEHNPIVKVELTEEGRIVERTHDLVVLSQGIIPATTTGNVFALPLASDGFISVPATDSSPCTTEHPGIFVTGTAGGPMDIVDSIISAGAAASEASAYIRENRDTAVPTKKTDRQEAAHV